MRGSVQSIDNDAAVSRPQFLNDGAERFHGALDDSDCKAIERLLAELPVDVPGVRLGAAPALERLLSTDGAIGAVAGSVLGRAAKPVRAVLFDKTAATNWGLGWHQDRTIVVAERAEVDGFGPWTVKSSGDATLIQVEPPFALLEKMVTVRVHLDAVDVTNAPLRIVPGSHRLGRVAEGRLDAIVTRFGERLCLAERGDIWLYATPILHASRPADPPRRRRVLQVDYSSEDLPPPLRWRGL